MKGPSHLIVGVCAVALLEHELGFLHQRTPLLIGDSNRDGIVLAGALLVGVVGALLPDIDSPNAVIRGWLGLAEHQTAWQVAGRFARSIFGGRRLLNQFLAWLTTLILWLPVALYRRIVRTTLDTTLEHRGPTHAPIFVCGLALLFGFALLRRLAWPGLLFPAWQDIGTAFVVGYASHLAADSLTQYGIPAFWPLFSQPVGLLPKWLRFRTGSLVEYVIVLALAGLTLWRYFA